MSYIFVVVMFGTLNYITSRKRGCQLITALLVHAQTSHESDLPFSVAHSTHHSHTLIIGNISDIRDPQIFFKVSGFSYIKHQPYLDHEKQIINLFIISGFSYIKLSYTWIIGNISATPRYRISFRKHTKFPGLVT